MLPSPKSQEQWSFGILVVLASRGLPGPPTSMILCAVSGFRVQAVVHCGASMLEEAS